MSLLTGLVHGGNQQLKKFAYDDVMRDEDRAKMPVSTTIRKAGDTDNTLFHYYSKLFVSGSERSTPEATTLAVKRVENRVQLAGRLHHIEEAVEVGMVSNKNKTYGADGLTEYERQRKEVLEDQIKSWERIFCGNGESQDGSNVAAFRTRGLGLFISPDATTLTDTNCLIPTAHRSADAACKQLHFNALDPAEVTNRFVLDDLTEVTSALYDVVNGPCDRDVVCTLAFKSAIGRMLDIDKVADGLTKVSRYNGDIQDKRLGYVVEIYVGDTGTLTFRLSTFLPAATETTDSTEAFVLDWERCWLHVRNVPGFYPVDNVALSKKTAIAGTQGLAVIPRYHGKFTRAFEAPES
jgi:hypothetical protein